MKKLISFLIFILCLNNFYSQNIKGKWYFVSSDMLKISEINFDSVKINSKQLDWNFEKIKSDSSKILKTIQKNNCNYYITENSQKKISLFLITNVNQNKSFNLPLLDQPHSIFKDIESAENFVKNDSIKERFGLTCYSEEFLKKIKLLKKLNKITAKEYAKFDTKMKEIEINYKENFQKMDLNFMFYYFYMPNITRDVLIKMGYNSIVSDSELELALKKFSKK